MYPSRKLSMHGSRPWLRSFSSGNRGAILVEMALVIPVLVTILIGAFWMGRAVSIYQALERAAREGARVGIAPACALCGGASTSDAQINDAVNNALTAASLDSSNPGLQIVIARNQPLNAGDPVGYQSSGIRVTVSYPVQLNIPFT